MSCGSVYARPRDRLTVGVPSGRVQSRTAICFGIEARVWKGRPNDERRELEDERRELFHKFGEMRTNTRLQQMPDIVCEDMDLLAVPLDVFTDIIGTLQRVVAQ